MEKVVLDYDVCIIGGGVAGIAASLASARSGKKTLLVESSFILGGLATSGLVTIYLPFDDGYGHQVSYGLCEELFRLSISKGYDGRYPKSWLEGNSIEERRKERLEVQFNPHVFALLCEEQLLKENVKILYGCIIRDVVVENNKIVKLLGTTKTQDIEINASSFVDCSGDATICEKAGLPVNYPKYGNVRAGWYYSVEDGQYKLNLLGTCDYIYTDKSDYEFFDAVDSLSLSDVTIKSHKDILDSFFKKGESSPSHALATIPTIPQVRMSRCLVGDYALKMDDSDKYQNHSIGVATYWYRRGFNYELPAEILFNSNITNLYVAGRCVSTYDENAWDVTRVIPVCVVTGEASGYLAANFYNNTCIDYEKAQGDLKNRNNKIHLSEIDFSK